MNISHKIFRASALAVLAALFSGCASIVSKSQYPVAIKTSPSGANFTIRNKSGVIVHRGKTPQTVTLDAGDGYFSGATYTVDFKKANYESTSTIIDSSVDGWYSVGNILFGGIIGWLIVDPATGAMWELPAQSLTELDVSENGDEIPRLPAANAAGTGKNGGHAPQPAATKTDAALSESETDSLSAEN